MASGESFSTMPAEFLVDKEFSIRELHYSERLDDRLEIESIKSFARDGHAD
jgi:hypothetical protein